MGVTQVPGPRGDSLTATLLPEDATYTAGDFQVWNGLLCLDIPKDWGPDASLSGGSPGTGRNALNSARIADLDVISGELQLVTDATATLWNAGSQTAAGVALQRTYPIDDRFRNVLLARITLESSASGDYAAAILYQRDALADFIRAGIEDGGSGTYDFLGQVPGSSAVRADVSSDTIWVALDTSVDPRDNTPSSAAWYADDSGTDVPTSWTRALINTGRLLEDDDLVRAFIVPSAGAAVTGHCSHFEWLRAPRELVTELDELPLGLFETVMTWGPHEFDTSGPVATWQRSLTRGMEVTDANLRTALQAAVAIGAESDFTARARWDGTPTGSYAALGSVSIENGGGEVLYIQVKMTSTSGAQPLAMGPINLQVT